ncbi:MAG: hypothetical protein R2795_13095 [Saprospiraceae bacterium]
MKEGYLRWRQHIPAFILQYAHDNPNTFGEKGLASFQRQYQVSESMYQQFVRFGKAQGESATPPTDTFTQRELKRFLKARLARQFYGDEGFYTIWNQEDEMVKEAVRLLRTENPLVAARKEKE